MRRGRRAGIRVRQRRLQSQNLLSVASVASSCELRAHAGSELSFALLNIRSIRNRHDDIINLMRNYDVLSLTETWSDVTSPVVGRLRAEGYTVIDVPRPRLVEDMSTNHGGVAVIARSTVCLQSVALVDHPFATFEHTCVRVTSSSDSILLVVVYRPGSAELSIAFVDDISSMLERLIVLGGPVYITGDFNVRFDHADNSIADQLRLLFESSGLSLRPTGPTHCRGGVLDVVIAAAPVDVALVDVGLSDHQLLDWKVPFVHTPPVRVTVSSRPWRRLNLAALRTAISDSLLCRPDDWPEDVDNLASMYDSVLTNMLDSLLPVSHFIRRKRPSDPWFDKDCRDAKRRMRTLQRRYLNLCRRSDPSAATLARDVWYYQRRHYRQLRHFKAQEFWRSRIELDRSNPKRLWRSIDTLLGRGRLAASTSISAEEYCQHFSQKVDTVRRATDGSLPPNFSPIESPSSLSTFQVTTAEEVALLIRRLPDNSSAADPIPTSVLKDVADLVAPYIAHLFNTSIAVGRFPSSFKRAFITPIIKKAGMDKEDVKSYRPISNLSVISKLLERLAARRLTIYLRDAKLLPLFQSGFRPLHSTETAVLKVLSDLLEALDRGDVGVLLLLDLSAAFDTVDHEILLQRLERTFGVSGRVLNWLASYLSGRDYFVRLGTDCSAVRQLTSGVPQGSVLGPLFFILYTVDLIKLIRSQNLQPHLYADDTQLYGSCRPGDTSSLADRVASCVDLVASWMRSNRLCLNSDKTEVLWISTVRRQHQLPVTPMLIDGAPVNPARTVRNLGVYIDSDLVMKTHVAKVVAQCFAVLRHLRHIRRSVSPSTLQTLVVALVLSRIDYANSVLTGLPGYLIKRLQSVLNAAARLIYGLRRYDHISNALVMLHWLRIPERIQFKLAVLTHRVLHGTVPSYLGPLTRLSDVPGRRSLRSASSHHVAIPLTRCSTVGARSFPVAGATVWNSLPSDIASIDSLPLFRRRLKTYLFRQSYPELVS